MRRLTPVAVLCLFAVFGICPLIVGCSTIPKGPFAKKLHEKKQSSEAKEAAETDAEADTGADAEARYKPVDKRLIVADEEDSPAEEDPANEDANIFEKSATDRKKVKETDGLSKMFEGLIDPRATEINKNLGYE
jgi:hypothetical protein